MAEKRKGLAWIFGISKIYVLTKDYAAGVNLGHSLPQDMAFKDKKKKIRMLITRDGRITVKKNYAWDGCTPKLSVFDLLILGTPDGIISDLTDKPKAYYASLVHDALYQFLPETDLYTRKTADDVFYKILENENFVPRRLYWLGVRIFGGLFVRARKNITRQTEGTVIPYRGRRG